MFFVDRLLIDGVRFVLDKVATAVDAELNDEGPLREELLAAEMQLELGEITQEQFTSIESGVLQRLREIREQREGSAASTDGFKVTGVDVSVGGDDDQ
jgi:hypothetical protein